jgi:hypothetical protein
MKELVALAFPVLKEYESKKRHQVPSSEGGRHEEGKELSGSSRSPVSDM